MLNDPEYLRKNQYANGGNLDARIALHALFSTNPYGWFRWMLDQINIPENGRVLELGCGTGGFWRQNLDRVPNSWQILLSDFSAGMLADARQNLETSLPNARFEVIDAQSIPYDDHCFDCVLANHMLYHIPDRTKALGEIMRVLASGGCLIATTIGENHLAELPLLLEKFDPGLAGKQMQWEITFSLENGAAELHKFFRQVELRRYEDGLRVTKPEPLVDYLLSSSRIGIDDAKKADFVGFVAEEISRNGGALSITKDSGMFICWKE
jgi:ubiquinone/menaquinone biosynthesis C-methylase UbiE